MKSTVPGTVVLRNAATRMFYAVINWHQSDNVYIQSCSNRRINRFTNAVIVGVDDKVMGPWLIDVVSRSRTTRIAFPAVIRRVSGMSVRLWIDCLYHQTAQTAEVACCVRHGIDTTAHCWTIQQECWAAVSTEADGRRQLGLGEESVLIYASCVCDNSRW